MPDESANRSGCREWGTGRVAFLERMDEIRALKASGWPLAKIYRSLQASLGGIRYGAFCYHVRRHLCDGTGTHGTPSPSISSRGARSSAPSDERHEHLAPACAPATSAPKGAPSARERRAVAQEDMREERKIDVEATGASTPSKGAPTAAPASLPATTSTRDGGPFVAIVEDHRSFKWDPTAESYEAKRARLIGGGTT